MPYHTPAFAWTTPVTVTSAVSCFLRSVVRILVFRLDESKLLPHLGFAYFLEPDGDGQELLVSKAP